METIQGFAPTGLPRDRFWVEAYTKVVKFKETPYLVDEETAQACISVLSSDGEVGTLSHLTIYHDARLFAQDLRDLVGKPNVPICLSGGWKAWIRSIQLRDGLVENLNRVGFVVSKSPYHSDLLGAYSRKATLFSDHVNVTRYPHSTEKVPAETRKLIFPIPIL